MAVKQHTDLSPSNADRWLNCPGSVALCAKCPKPPQSKYAAEGTAAHAVLERCLRDFKINPYDLIGETVEGFEVDEEMAEAVSYAVNVVKEELQKGGTLLIEQKVEIAPGISGTLDIAIIREFESITIYDFKYGKGVIVKAADNPQLLMYLLPLFEVNDVLRLKIGVIQPRTDEQLNTWEPTLAYMDYFRERLKTGIAFAKEPNALIMAGDWCKWCYAKVSCPKLRGKIADALPAIPGKELVLPDVKSLDAPVLRKILDVAPLFEEWMSAVAAYAKEYVEAGGEILGYELAKKRANRKWVDEEAALKEFADLGEQAFKVKILSPAQMEKVADKKRVAALTEVPDNGTTLKKIGDKK